MARIYGPDVIEKLLTENEYHYTVFTSEFCNLMNYHDMWDKCHILTMCFSLTVNSSRWVEINKNIVLKLSNGWSADTLFVKVKGHSTEMFYIDNIERPLLTGGL